MEAEIAEIVEHAAEAAKNGTDPDRSRPSRTSMPERTYREAVRDALAEAMRADKEVVIVGEDIAEMGGSMGETQGMLDEFGPERVRNTPISEIAIVGVAIGAAIQGMRPVIEIMYEDFLTLGMEQLVNQAAKHRSMSGGQLKVPFTVRTQGGAGWSPGAQHAQQVEAWFVHVPGLKVVFARRRPTSAGSCGRRSTTTTRSCSSSTGRCTGSRRRCRRSSSRSRRQGAHPPGGMGRDGRGDREARARIHEGVGGGRVGRRLGRGPRPADAPAARRGGDRLVRPEDDPLRRRPRSGRADGLRHRGGWLVQHARVRLLDAPIERVGAKFAPLPFAPVMENYVVPHASDVLEAIKRTVARGNG